MLKSLILKAVGALGYDLRPKDGRATLEGALRHARRMGVAPATVFDVGAGFGTFTVACARVFPQADYHLIEPLDEFEAALSRLCTRIDRARVHKVAAAARSGRVTLHVHDDLVGSSLLTECEGPAVDGVAREVAVLTVDEIAGAAKARPPFLLKADVQGAELEVLDGAAGVLADAEMVVLETSFFRFFKGGPPIAEVIAAMNGRGFALYDLFGLSHRPLDGALAQADCVFVKEDGPLRAHHHYATPEQRRVLTARLRSALPR